MCELFAMSSRGPATVTLLLGVLAEHGGNVAPHKDGWGIAFYDEGDARILKDTDGASHSKWVQFVERQEIRSTLVLSHIRLATDGGVSTRNTQPFANDLGQFGPANFLYCDGEVLFAHGHRRKQADGQYSPPGLFWLHRQCAREDLFSATSGVSVISPNQHVILVASVPLIEEAWEPFHEGEVIAISDGELKARVPAPKPALVAE